MLRGHNANALFSMLRPNDLIWNYWVRNNLMGEEPPAFDVLAWNSDATRLPAALHADFLDCSCSNSLATGTCSVHGNPVDLSKVECDSFVVGARTDHLTAWKACYATTQLMGGRASSPSPRRATSRAWSTRPAIRSMTRGHRPEATDADPDEWLAKTTAVTGSWWEPWAGGPRPAPVAAHPAPSSLGSAAHPARRPRARDATSWPLERPVDAGAGIGAGREPVQRSGK